MKIIGIIILLGIAGLSYGQQFKKQKKERFPSFFGISVSPVIPNNFIGAVKTDFKDSAESMSVNFKNTWNFTFGGTVRIGLSKLISLETGISQVRRTYETSVSIPDSSINSNSKLLFINYDVPLNALFYVQMTKHWYMDASLGVSITHYPSDVRKIDNASSNETVTNELRRTNRTYFALNASIGFEYRTDKIGNFYLGFGAKVPFKQPYFGVVIYEKSGYGTKTTAYKPISGGYFTIDLRYFLPAFKKNGIQPNKSIVE